MNPEERDTLIDALLDGECSEADFLRLEAEMHVSREARQAYYERQRLHALLQTVAADADEITSNAVISFPSFGGSQGGWLPWAMGIAAAVMLLWMAGGLGWKLGKEGVPATVEVSTPEPIARGFGVLAEASGAVWGGEHAKGLKRGDLLPEGELHLQAGMAQLELFSGVSVMVDGEARFSVISPMEMQVMSGRMRADVPEPARGFRVRTSSGDVVDLGTEFALQVSDDSADVLVLDGEVEWHPTSPSDVAAVKTLEDGEGLRWTKGTGASPIPTALES
ncbi:MAG: FecR family protein, partial [Verrucomicrobiota bacterium]